MNTTATPKPRAPRHSTDVPGEERGRCRPLYHTVMRRLLYLLGIALAVDLILVVLYLGWCHKVIEEHRTARGKLDAGMLFFSGFTPDDGLDPEAISRVKHAAGLFAQGRIQYLVCLGGRRRDPERFGAQLMAERLRTLGVPEAAIRVDFDSFDTIGNWRRGVAILEREGWQRPLLISGPLHLARISHIAAEPFPLQLSPTRSVWDRSLQEPIGSWAYVHREWSAWLVMWLLPPETHQELVELWRNFWD